MPSTAGRRIVRDYEAGVPIANSARFVLARGQDTLGQAEQPTLSSP